MSTTPELQANVVESSAVQHLSDEAAMLAFACGVVDRILDILRDVRPRIRVGIEDGGSLRWLKMARSGPLQQFFRVRWIVRVRNVLRETRPTPTLGSCGFAVAVDAQSISIYGGRRRDRRRTEFKDFSQDWLDRALKDCAAAFCGRARLIAE